MSSLNGIIPVDKPSGPTSHDVVSIARKAFGLRRIGHTGTLDPFASGLLLLCLGPSTRLAEYLTALPKSYVATLRLGISTDTDDLEGEILHTSEAWSRISAEEASAALRLQMGELLQTPPQYSAKKIGGERMYALARRKETVAPVPVPVTVHRIGLKRFEPPELEFEVDCSSGTYIRSIARDVGETLGVGGHLTALRRTRIGDRSVEDSLAIAELGNPDAVSRALIPPAAAVGHLPRVTLDPEEAEIVAHGGRIRRRFEPPSDGPIALLSPEGRLAAIGFPSEDVIHPRKVFG